MKTLKHTTLLTIILLASVQCGQQTVTTIPQARVVVYEGLSAIQDVETTLFQAGGVVTPEQHKEFNALLVPLLEAGRDFDRAVSALPAGRPTPSEAQALVTKLSTFTQSVVKLFPDGNAKSKILAAVVQAQDFVARALVVFDGGVQ